MSLLFLHTQVCSCTKIIHGMTENNPAVTFTTIIIVSTGDSYMDKSCGLRDIPMRICPTASRIILTVLALYYSKSGEMIWWCVVHTMLDHNFYNFVVLFSKMVFKISSPISPQNDSPIWIPIQENWFITRKMIQYKFRHMICHRKLCFSNQLSSVYS